MKKTHILFVHGFAGSPIEHLEIREYLKKHKHIVSHSFEYPEKWGNISFEELGKRCAKIIAQEKIDIIVGISQGGIIASYALEHFKTSVHTCITICTPWHGSYLAYGLPLVGTNELQPKSDFLKKLNLRAQKSDHNYYAVWNPLDLMVFPGKSAHIPFAKANCKVYSPLHPTTFSAKKTIAFLDDIIKRHAC